MGLFETIVDTFQQAAIYILVGLFFSGIIQAFISPAHVTRHLGPANFKSVFLAAVVGIPLPLCSCGVIPAAIALRRNGASKGATLAFLISTPETGMDSILLSFALLDPLMATFRPLAALFTALIAGVMENIFGSRDKQGIDAVTGENDEQASGKGNIWRRLKHGLGSAFGDLLADITPWLLFGLLLAGVLSYMVPANFVERFLGHGLFSMILILIVSIPLYICASASTPIAAALLLKGMNPGAALVFLLVGPATNIATIVMAWKFLGRRATLIYLSSLSVCAVALGLLLDQIYVWMKLDIKALIGQAAHCWPEQIQMLAAAVLVLLMARALWKKHF